MNIINDSIKIKIDNGILSNLRSNNFAKVNKHIENVLSELYNNIPDNKRSSYGVVHTMKVLTDFLFSEIESTSLSTYAINIYNKAKHHNVKGVGLGLITYQSLNNFKFGVRYFLDAASSNNWQLREYAQMFFRKVTNKYPEKTQLFLFEQAESEEANIRRFVAETLRPVVENRWILKEPNYSLSVLNKMFNDNNRYVRNSVGNNLSDLSKHHPELILDLVRKLTLSKDINAYKIAWRACRNLVKKYPLEVFGALNTNEYKYKSSIYRRSDY